MVNSVNDYLEYIERLNAKEVDIISVVPSLIHRWPHDYINFTTAIRIHMIEQIVKLMNGLIKNISKGGDMGWAYCGKDEDGRDIGYSVEAKCDEPGCDADIDRGLSYVCGGMHGGDGVGCGKYFCGKHLFYGSPDDCRETYQLCKKCFALNKEDIQ
jgi:hypothetical protein